MKINGIDLSRIDKTIQEFRNNPESAKKVNRLVGRWNPASGSRFSAELEFNNEKILLLADQAPPMGGAGSAPSPIQYCLFGLASCFGSTFVAMAALHNVTLDDVQVAVESQVNFSRMFGLSEDPIIESVEITLSVQSSASPEEIRHLEEMARNRCPAVFCLEHPIPINTKVVPKA